MKKVASFFLLLIMLTACSKQNSVYKIAVSQCSVGNWRSKVNNEMLAAQHLFEQDVEVEIINCYDQSDVQVRQIDSLAESGIDLLVVAPNDYKEVAPALKRAKERGIPIVLFDRMSNSDDYTAFIGSDNVAIGSLAGTYAVELATQTESHSVLEITALQKTSPAHDRHQGFSVVMEKHPEIDYRCIFGDWDDNHTYDILSKELREGRRPDVVFCHSDFMAMGAHRAVAEANMEQEVKVIGVDGLPGPNEGIEGVQKGWLAGTCVYPTHGEEIVKLALNILNGKPYERINYLNIMMITPQNADMISRYANELKSQNEDLVVIQDKLENYFGLYHVQTKIIWAAVLAIILLIVAVALTWLAVQQTRKAHRKQKALNDEQTRFYTNASHQLKTPLTLIAGPVKQLLEHDVLKGDDRGLLEIVERNVNQLESLVSNVLNFRREIQATISDDTVMNTTKTNVPKDIIHETHLEMLNQEDAEELPNILIVEDNDDMRHYLRTLLADRFYVIEASDGQNGLKLARESVPDIIVSDVMMPVMDGLQLCKHLKEDFITSHIPVILLTARSEEHQQMEGYESGADAYLTKPFSANLLISRIYNLLNNRKQLRSMFDGSKQSNMTDEVKLTTQDKLFIDQLKEAINSNLSNPNLKMDELGEQLGISRVQLYRKVKTLTGLSPVELLRQMRLQKAKTLLNSTTKTVAEIAYEVGFNSSSYFSNCFKKQFGKLPMELRE
ncbi:MAG: substrate-binding domain-containing protein [Prevotella sp.]|nr:substrate-binding domain-containing protein [Prevotella sp.]MBR1556548.1 substrate-binding domain-containing protein [Prevotella sp.]MBR1901915.1 substrate-binding domain-containing protein [Bacteroidaceae bacterium]